MKSNQYKQFLAGVSFAETQLGEKWRPALDSLAGGGVAIGLDAKHEGVGIAVRSKNAESVQKLVDTIVGLVKLGAGGDEKKTQVKTAEYRGVKAHRIDEMILGVVDNWLLVSNKGDLLKEMVDRAQGDGESLAQSKNFQAAKKAVEGEPHGWGYLDVESLRTSGAAKNVFENQSDNILVELLFGGLQSVARNTPYLTASVFIESEQARVQLSAPFAADWAPEERTFYFGPEAKGRAPELLKVEERILAIGTYRNVAEMWLRAGDLFGERVNDQLAAADSVLTTFFSGKDFAEDILGAVEPEFQFIVARQSYAKELPTPAIKLPSFALVTKLKDPKMRRELRRTFQSLIGFINVTGAMNGQPQFDLDMEVVGDAELVTASYSPDADEENLRAARINYNFSPAVGFVGEHFIVSSTRDLAAKLSAAAGKSAANASSANTALHAGLAPLQRILVDNRSHLVAQNMLEDGNTKEQAEQQMDIIFGLLAAIQDASLKLESGDGQIQLALTINSATEQKKQTK